MSHAAFKGGYVDTMRIETPVAISYVKRYYFAQGGRGCSLSFEAREDVFPRASRWADYIASTLRFGERGGRREVNATLARLGDGLGRLLRGPDRLVVEVGPEGPAGDFEVPVRGTTATWETTAGPGPLLPAARPSPPTTSTASCPRPSGAGRPAGLWVEVEYRGRPLRRVPAAVRLDRPERQPRTASTRPPSSAGSPRRWACAASGAPSSTCPTSTPAARRTRAPPSASSSAASCSSPRVAVSLAAPPDLAAFPAVAPAARAAQDAGPPLPDQLPLRRDHERVQLQVHLVPRRDHGPPARLHEEGARLPHLRRDRGEAVVARPALPGEAPPDGRADAPPGPARDRGLRGGARRRHRAQHELRPHHRGADRGALPGRPHQPDPLVPDAGPRDASRRARPRSSSSTSTATRSAWPSSARWPSARARTSRSTS